MHATDIVGYTYNADQYCSACTLNVFGNVLDTSAEALLNREAVAMGVNRQDERSFDSGDFPKVIFGDMVHDGCTAANGYEPGQCGDRCGKCGEPLGVDECPNAVVPA